MKVDPGQCTPAEPHPGTTTCAPICRLGLPLWSRRDWVGRLYSGSSRSEGFLTQYASVFRAVEGNTTFYGVPGATQVERWAEQTPAEFRFCFKLPRSITHDRELDGCAGLARDFLSRMAPLGPRLGPFMIQLSARFGPQRLEILDRFLGQLPVEHHYAVELRHPAWFDRGPRSAELNRVLAARGCDRVVLDTRGVRAGPQNHPDIQAARHPKPNLPLELDAPGQRPIVRFIGHPEPSVNDASLRDWARVLNRWSLEGRHAYFFVHCPNDRHAPDLARRAHGLLRKRLALDAMPAWPGERESPRARQQCLF